MDDELAAVRGLQTAFLSLDRYAFDATTNQGRFDTSLQQGKRSRHFGSHREAVPDAMTVRTPTAMLGFAAPNSWSARD